MKGQFWYILALVAFIALMFWVEYSQPKHFVWKPTFSQYDEQPFGCKVFDEILEDAWEEDYYVSRYTFPQMAGDSTKYAILSIADRQDLSPLEVKSMLEMARYGCKIILAGNYFSKALKDSLHFQCSFSYFSVQQLKGYVGQGYKRDSLYWVGDSMTYPSRIYEFFPQMFETHFTERDSLSICLAQKKRPNGDDLSVETPVAMRMAVGEGEIYLVSTPLLFTNYGMLDRNNATYLFRLLSPLNDLPMIRTEVYGSPDTKPQSPLRYFLSQRPLRWAVYLTMVTILLFMIFTARRRQRAIPVVDAPENRTMEFTELIGTLYYQGQDHSDLVRKKFTYFAEHLRRQIQVDVEDETDDNALCRRISQKSGLDEHRLQVLFRGLRPVMHGERMVSEELMKEYINRMDEIINHL